MGLSRKGPDSGNRFKVLAVLIALAAVAAGFYYLGTLGHGGGKAPRKAPRKPVVAVVDVEGVIENFHDAHVVSKVAKREAVEAAVVKVNSPGGYVSPCFQLESAISGLSEEIPTVGAVGGLGASGAYLAASAVDNLYVHHSSLVGSVGVIAVWTSLENHYRQEGIEHYVFKTAPHKDMFAPWRGPTENEKDMIREEIGRIQDRMISAIYRNRPALENEIPGTVLKGDVVRGFRSVEMGLADAVIGTYEEAVGKAAEAAGLEEGEYRVVRAENLVS